MEALFRNENWGSKEVELTEKANCYESVGKLLKPVIRQDQLFFNLKVIRNALVNQACLGCTRIALVLDLQTLLFSI